MTITTLDQLLDKLANAPSRLILDKAALTGQTAGVFCSMWRAVGQPAQGAIPGTTPEIPTEATLGAPSFPSQTSPATTYLGHFVFACSNPIATLEIHDRVAHMGGLVANIITLQTITGHDLDTLGLVAARRGAANFSEMQWWMETYTSYGFTVATATVNVTYDDATTGNLNVVPMTGLQQGMLTSLTPFIPVAQQGKFIRGINSTQLSAAAGSPGNHGFTCTRRRTVVPGLVANFTTSMDWAALGLPEIPNNACLMFIVLPTGVNTGTLRGGGSLAHG